MEFGDFQTPDLLALEVCELLRRRKIHPKSVIEPNCGKGSFLKAAIHTFPGLQTAHGFDINAEHLKLARKQLDSKKNHTKILIKKSDFFKSDWKAVLENLPQPQLIIGNPPWVTNSAIGQTKSRRTRSSNLPAKSPQVGHRGLDSVTGKSNFDISEWMLFKLLQSIQGTEARVAMLIKTSVARKILKSAYENRLLFSNARLYPINSRGSFGVSVDAGLFEFGAKAGTRDYKCRVFQNFKSSKESSSFGIVAGRMVSNIASYLSHRRIEGKSIGQWRSGIKHDCSRVMELRRNGSRHSNGKAESVEIEDTYLFPLLKSSDLTKSPLPLGQRDVIVTQTSIGESTHSIKAAAPKTWSYLLKNKKTLRARKSSIYKGKPEFSIFGVGKYSFAPWKVAISGLYKQTRFTLIGPMAAKPVMLDDTCYFLPFENRQTAKRCLNFLNSKPVQAFLNTVIFWDAKRPINAELLNRIRIR